ncbi:hypothetical protein [Chryseobacterium arthrosphaerae]|uniref:hypothetical protein n=1 Tax=Chryseobacterium arthrosphaerae TaxID=651561 RepID=UPI001E3595A5|nr:hypothetical protein [Chryseobacterium arthrosphaerae]UEQ75879.1 hypothetical protein J8N07_19890 [Chryseobacterium arthrosphaerae]
MLKPFYRIFFILTFLVSCKYSNQSTQEKVSKATSDIPKVLKSENINPKLSSEIDFDIVKPFKHIENENRFESDDIKLISKTDNSFMLTKKDFAVDEIDLSESNYEGPGYNIFSFQSKENTSFEIVLIEATADIGTDWYYVIVLNNENLIDQFYIKEPRANSEDTNIGNFIKISMNNNVLNLKFAKNKIARYSKSVSNLKSDNQYFYLTRKLKY